MKKLINVTIQDWMYDLPINDIREMFLFAVLFSLSNNGRNEVEISYNELSSWLMVSRRTTITLIKKLIEKRLVVKVKEGGKCSSNVYRVSSF